MLGMVKSRLAIAIFAAALSLLGSCNARAPQSSSSAVERPGEGSRTTGALTGILLRDIADDTSDRENEPDFEPSIAVNSTKPSEIAVVAFSGSWGVRADGTAVNAPVWKSTDGGNTWKKLPLIPPPPPLQLATGRKVTLVGPADQHIAYDSSGHLWIAEMARDRDDGNFTVNVLYRQTGGPEAPLTSGLVFGDGIADQPQVGVDVSLHGCEAATIYTSWLKTDHENSVNTVSRSGKDARTVPVAPDLELPTRSTRIATGPDGKAYLMYKTRQPSGSDFEPVFFRVRRSDDCGITWNALGPAGVSIHGPNHVTSYYSSDFGDLAKTKLEARARVRSSDAWLALDPVSADVYAAYVNRDSSGFGQIYVARSTNQGRTWTSTRVTDGRAHSAVPEIAVTANGAVGVLYIDYVEIGSATRFRHNFAVSTDLGATWSSQLLQSMDPATLSNVDVGVDLWGDYEGLTAAGTTFYGVFTGVSIGRKTTQLDPIFFKLAMQTGAPGR